MKNRVGLLGGTFDPFHNGHLKFAQCAVKKYSLKKVTFIPSSMPPHKEKTLASFAHRLAMIKLGVKQYPYLDVSDLEGRLSKPSYTYRTISHLRKSNPHEKYCFLIGMDAFLDIKSWMNYDQILNEIDFIVANRKGIIQNNFKVLTENLSYRQFKENAWQNRNTQKHIYLLEDSIPGISSTTVRQWKAGDRIVPNDFLQDDVAQYIKENALYTCITKMED